MHQLKNLKHIHHFALKRPAKAIILALAACAVLVGSFYLKQSLEADNTILTYDHCVHLVGSKVTAVTPRVCTALDGKQVVNPADQHDCYRARYISDPRSCR